MSRTLISSPAFHPHPWSGSIRRTGSLLAACILIALGCRKPDSPSPVASANPSAPAQPGASHGSTPGPARRQCAEHAVPLDECGICRPESIGRLDPGQGLKVRLTSGDAAALIGVVAAPPQRGTATNSVECYAELSYNLGRLAQVSAPVGGIVQKVEADLGDRVVERQVVARIWSASIAEAVAHAVLTHQTLDRERRLREERVTSQKDLQEAEAAHRAACQQLRTLGFTEEQVDDLGARPEDSVFIEVRAPLAGEIIERLAVQGTLVEAGRPLFTVADRTTAWAMLNVPETALALVQVGQTVELRVDSLPDRTFTGRLAWIGPEVDERTRMARARAEIPNPDGILRSRMYAQAQIQTQRRDHALLIPIDAVQRVGDRSLVFVRLADDLFEVRAVRLGTRSGDRYEVVAGLGETDPVVGPRAFALRSALLISRLGAGCAED
jgi:RND family efflux transporter MFP subunit